MQRRLLSLLLVAVLLPTWLAATPAQAAHQRLEWNGGATFARFGPNANVSISLGTLEWACDTFMFASNIYVVPSGSVSAGAELTDVSGTPNTVISSLQGGLFMDETIGFTAPSGTIGAGTYAVVYDECQDGRFDQGLDKVFDPAFEVVLPDDVSDLPQDAFGDLKADAAEQAEAGEEAAALFAALMIAYDIYAFANLGSGAQMMVNVYLNYICSIPSDMGGLPGIPDSPITPWCPTVSIQDTVKLQMAATKLLLDEAAHWEGIAADPPDPNFAAPAIHGPRAGFQAQTTDPLEAAIVAFAQRTAVSETASRTLLASLEKYQGADIESSGSAALMHARNIQRDARLLAANLTATNGEIDAVLAELQASGRDLESLSDRLKLERDRVRANGLSAEERELLAELGLSQSDIADVEQRFEAFPATEFRDLGGIDAVLARLKAQNLATAQSLEGMAAAVDANIAALVAQGLDITPIPHAGGPYSAVEGQAAQLDASASVDPRGKPLSYAWDLDGDAEFDDATGAQAQYTFPRAFTGQVAVKVTNSDGRYNVAYAPITVGEANRPARIDGVQPTNSEPVELEIGATQAFSATASDPDGDPVTLTWSVNDVEVAGGAAFTFDATPDTLGVNVVSVRASDGLPLGGGTEARWLVKARLPDGDGDGYRQNRDCDDGDPSVNPGQSEVIGNGKDDDCDERTSDEGGPPVAFFNPEGSGRNVALYEGGATAHSVSSQYSSGYAPQYMLNHSANEVGWRTANGKRSDEWVVIALAGGQTYQIDRFKLMPGGGNEGVKAFSLAVSTAGPDGPYTTVFTGTAPLNGPLQEYILPQPVSAKYVRLNALSNHSESACCIMVKQLQIYTSQEGERTVSFENLTVDSDDDIVSWTWDFGDGTTSSEQHPTHTYAAESRSYTVSLTATDQGGNVSTYSLPYRVLLPPVADFTVTPTTPSEGSRATYTDISTDPDGLGMIATRTWSWNNSANQTSASASMNYTFQDSGSFVVRLQVIDTQGQVATLEKLITVANVAPTVVPPAAQTVVWGQNLNMAAVNVNDASFSDRGNLTCEWSFGGGDTARIERCNSTSARVAYAYADPGAYTPALTVTDPDGGATSVGTPVTVAKRDSFVQVLSVHNVADGNVEITAKVFDTHTWAALPGWDITFTAGAASATVRTGADGAATATLPRAAGVDAVGVGVAATSHYNGSSMERLIEAPLGDVVFIVDESGSMNDDQVDLRNNLNRIAMQLAAEVDFQIGLVGFGAAGNTHGAQVNGQGHIHIPFSNDVGAVGQAIAGLVANGGYEAGFDGTAVAMGDAMGFRPNAGACAVLVTDDNADFGGQLPTTREEAVAALQGRNAVFLGIISPGIPGSQDHYGMNPGSLAAATGGQVWNITDFRRDPQPVLDAILTSCLASITRVDLSLSVSDGQETARAGDELTYTLTVSNVSTGLARNIALADTLPAGASFVSAGDGGAFAGGEVTWPAFDLAAGESATRTLTVRLDGQLAAGTQLVNAATVADDGQSGPDRTPADNSASDTTTVEAPLNTAPVAEGQSVDATEDTAAPITLGASDPDGDALTYTIVAQPQHGALSGAAPDLTYTPTADYHGADSFTFKVNDGALDSNLATVSITVAPANDAPTADAGPDQAVVAGAPVALDGAASSDPDGDALSFAWAQESGPAASLTGADTAAPEFTPTAAGDYTFKLTVSDGAASAEDSVTITVELPPNRAPEARDDAASTDEDAPVVVDVLANDADADGDTLGVSALGAAANGTAELILDGPDAGKVRYTPAADFSGTDSFTYTVDDGRGGAAQATVTITIAAVNDAPLVEAGADQSIAEGGSVTITATFSDKESAEQQYTCVVDWGDGETSSGAVTAPSGGQPGTCEASHTYTDDDPTGTPSDTYTVSVTVEDSGSPASSGSDGLGVTVHNVAPAIVGVAAPVGSVSLGSAVEITFSLADAGAADTHSCAVSWGDGASETVAASGGACVATRTYAGPGVYTVGVTVTDDDGGSASEQYRYVVVYDPSGGFVTGGGWIISPAGACRLTEACAEATGRANFGFVAKYKKGAQVPEGQTEFQFKAGGLNFHSSRYDWLVVAGAKAQYKGEGTINGQGSYGFMVTAVDGQINGGGGVDRLRVKIWDRATGAVVYDNQVGAGDDAEPSTAIEGGNITIHK